MFDHEIMHLFHDFPRKISDKPLITFIGLSFLLRALFGPEVKIDFKSNINLKVGQDKAFQKTSSS